MRFWFWLLGLTAVLWSTNVRAQEIPPELEAWKGWALGEDGKTQLCPRVGTEPRCVWPTKIDFNVSAKEGTFVFEALTLSEGPLTLPGDHKHWPLSVRVDGKAAPVVSTSEDAPPTVRIPAGKHRIEGQFLWDSIPESLVLPRELGLVALTLKGKRVDSPERDAQGILWLRTGDASNASAQDSLEVRVHRKVTDAIPLQFTTRITLNVSGKAREVVLGKPLSETLVPLLLTAPIPVRLDSDGHIRVQVRPGTFEITLVARSKAAVSDLARPKPGGLWHQGTEVWSFEAQNALRLVTIDGVPSIDPNQTSMPAEWKSLPAYVMGDEGAMHFNEKQRGDANPGPNRLNLVRHYWLDFDGHGATFQDRVSGDMRQGYRLEMGRELELGRVSLNSLDVFITTMPGTDRAGVEIRQGTLNVSADGRLPSLGTPIAAQVPAVAWNHDVESASLQVSLPHGWDLFYARGVDTLSQSWVSAWRLLEIFLCMVLTVAFARLFGPKWGAVAFVALALSLTRDGSLRWFWFVPLALEALRRFTQDKQGDRAQRFVSVLRYAQVGVLGILCVSLLPFFIDEARHALHPALQHGDGYAFDGKGDDKEGGTGTRARGEEGAMNDSPAPATVAPAAPPAEEAEPKPEPKKPMESGKKADNSKLRDALPSSQPVRQQGPAQGYGRLSSVSQSNSRTYDPKAVVQTGPGIPQWTFRTITLGFNGPVKHDQVVTLYLLSPGVQLALAALRLGALAALLFCIGRAIRISWSQVARSATAAATAVLFALIITPRVAHAEVPSAEVLKDLKERVLRPAPCGSSCGDVTRLYLTVSPETTRIRLDVAAQVDLGLPLPGSLAQWEPTVITLDGKAAPLLRGADGRLLARIEKGVHTIDLMGPTPKRDAVQISLPLRPHYAQATAPGFTVDGIHEDGQCDETLQFSAIAKVAATPDKTTEAAVILPSFLRVERTLHLGLNWQVTTTVHRVSPASSGAVVAQIPLLPGEAPTTDVKIEQGKVQVNLAADTHMMQWQSTLTERPTIDLVAPTTLEWFEVWKLDVGPLWHATLSGINVIHHAQGGVLLPEWYPWPGEKASIAISKPAGLGGQTVTIDRSLYRVVPGARSLSAELTLSLRSSKGGEHAILLPEGAELRDVKVDGTLLPVSLVGRKLAIPLHPGNQELVVTWREARGMSVAFAPSAIDYGTPSVNATTQLNLDEAGRWTLLLRGVQLGPSVLFWSVFGVLLVVAIALSRISWVPIRSWEWLLLFVGLSQTTVVFAAIFTIWLLALGYRGRAKLSPQLHNLFQVTIIFLSLGAFGILIGALYQGLLGDPNMQVDGNGSSAMVLRWYEDRVSQGPSLPTIISVPMLAYRIAMLAWALWLAFAILRWIKWGWDNMNGGGFWQTWRVRPVAPVATSAATPPASQTPSTNEGDPPPA